MSRSSVQTAMVLMIVAMLIIPAIDAIAKWMSASIAAGQVSWSRFVFQTLFLAPLVLAHPGSLKTRNVGYHAARGTLIAVATLLFFASLKFLPIADAIAIFFVEPLLVTLLAALFLGEPVRWRRMTAVLVGLFGALLIVRPNFEQFGWYAILPMGAALNFAVYILLTRSISQREKPAIMQFHAGIFGALVMSAALLVGEQLDVEVLSFNWPTLVEWCLLALLGLVATVAHLLMVHAYQRAPVAILAPFQYVEIISATLLGYLVFKDFPDLLTWCGIAAIVSSGMYVFYRERQLARAA